MFRVLMVLRGVLVLRRIAASDMAAGQAQTKVHPGVAHLEAFFAAGWSVRLASVFVVCDGAQVSTSFHDEIVISLTAEE
jgi:hypothetical protein